MFLIIVSTYMFAAKYGNRSRSIIIFKLLILCFIALGKYLAHAIFLTVESS